MTLKFHLLYNNHTLFEHCLCHSHVHFMQSPSVALCFGKLWLWGTPYGCLVYNIINSIMCSFFFVQCTHEMHNPESRAVQWALNSEIFMLTWNYTAKESIDHSELSVQMAHIVHANMKKWWEPVILWHYTLFSNGIVHLRYVEVYLSFKYIASRSSKSESSLTRLVKSGRCWGCAAQHDIIISQLHGSD